MITASERLINNQGTITYASEISSEIKAKIDFDKLEKKDQYDTFEKRDLSSVMVCETYSKIQYKMSMPKSVFGDQFGYDMQKSIGNCMKDFYDGKKSQSEVENYFEECCESMRMYRTSIFQTSGSDEVDNKQIVSQVYEIFAKENQRATRYCNYYEGLARNQQYGGRNDDWVYYNSEYYFKCEETKAMLRECTDKMVNEWKLPSINTQEIEDNSKFTLDGGFDFNSGWNWASRNQTGRASMENESTVPPKNFIFFYKQGYTDKEGIVDMNLEQEDYNVKVPFSVSRDGSYKGQIYDLNELLSDLITKKTGNNDYHDFLKCITIFTRAYSSRSRINDIFGNYKAER